MSTDHGGIVTQAPIGEYAKYIKNLIPANIPETYTLKPMFSSVASDEDIRNGVCAFRDFLYVFCDRLISDGQLYSKPQKTKNPIDYPFLNYVNWLLIDMGYYGTLSESGETLSVVSIPSFATQKPKIPASKQMDCLRFLMSCGLIFTGVDLDAKIFDIPNGQALEVSYPNAPVLLTGLKALSIASKELWVRFYNTANELWRCDYSVIKAEDTDAGDTLKDILHPLPENIRQFALGLHQRYIDKGMACVKLNDNMVHFAYAKISKSSKNQSIRDIYQRRVWEFALSMKYGYCIIVRAKKTDKYTDIIKRFPLSLQDRIAGGYGCDRKLRGEPCQGGCQGIRIPLDDAILNICSAIETWLDLEVS